MQVKSILLIAFLVMIAVSAMALAQVLTVPSNPPSMAEKAGSLKAGVQLVQQKVLKNSDGTVAVAVTFAADAAAEDEIPVRRPVDLTVVLDRSGSMAGEKMNHALAALTRLLEDLTPADRLALVSYSDGASVHSGLTAMTPQNRQRMAGVIAQIRPGGGTNLGVGFMAARELIPSVDDTLRVRHLLVISDGLVNQGITDPLRLGQMAADAGRRGISVGTVGVGSDFNEVLMTQLADQGQGRYYFLENPVAFAGLFTEEYRRLGTLAATDLRLEIERLDGVTLVDAAGYPIESAGGRWVVRPGNIKAGDTRTLYLTFRVPTKEVGSVSLGQLVLSYRQKDHLFNLPIGSKLSLACVDDPTAVWASIEKKQWTDKVLKNDYNRLKKELADDIRKGDKARAMERLESYRRRQTEANAAVQSEEVKANLEQELDSLSFQLQETFSGAPSAVMQKQKAVSKSLHYDGYKGQRSVK